MDAIVNFICAAIIFIGVLFCLNFLFLCCSEDDVTEWDHLDPVYVNPDAAYGDVDNTGEGYDL